MSTTTALPNDTQRPRFLHAEAMAVANRFIAFLEPYCTRILVAGSLRRRRQTVKDIELLFVPKMISVPDPCDMFGGTKLVAATDAPIAKLLDLGVITKRPSKTGVYTWGAENKLARHLASGIPVDLFATDEDHFWMALFVRTGPAELNTRVASLAIARGLRMHAYGNGFSRGSQAVRVKSEREIFELVGLDYLEPWDR